MELPKTTEARIQCIRDAAARLGGNAALGRALGYRDGAFVGQMLRGERPVTEKTLLAMSKVHQLASLFGATHPSPPPSQEAAGKLDIGGTVARLGELLDQLPDLASRDEAVQRLGTFALATDSARARAALIEALQPVRDDAPPVETSDFAGTPPRRAMEPR